MKKTISLLLSIAMLIGVLSANVNAYAAGFASYAKSLELNSLYLDWGTKSDYYNKSTKNYSDIYIIDVPCNGVVTINMASEDQDYFFATYENKVNIYDYNTNNNVYSFYRERAKHDDVNGCFYVSYSANLGIGTYYIELTFDGWSVENNYYESGYNIIFNYSPSITKPSSLNLATNKKHKITAKWSKVGDCEGYQVQYSKNKNFSSKTTKTISDRSKAKYTGTFTKNKTYYFRVRSYITIDGTKYYSSWSKAKSIKCK